MYRRSFPLKGLITGTVSGLVGTILMTEFQNISKKLTDRWEEPRTESAESQKSAEEKEDSTVKTAARIAEATGHKLPANEKKKAGNLVHYGFGSTLGSGYGLMRESGPKSFRRMDPWLAGTTYGAGVFVAAHEVAVPALRLSPNPFEDPLVEHVTHLLSHVVYGVGTALSYGLLRKLWVSRDE
jgi:uncharacterized membrane protein YagU involved in acid resistance